MTNPSNPRDEGRKAYATGARNPYAFGSAENHEWAAGWHEASPGWAVAA